MNLFIRYERKKKIEIALGAMKHFRSLQSTCSSGQPRTIMIVAGGYDTSVNENVEYLKVLINLS